MANDTWETPPEIFAWHARDFNFVLDAAASDENHKCEVYITEEQDSLSIDWHEVVQEENKSGGWVWLNCPYSNPLPWVTKALETQRKGTGVVMLLNNDMSVRWFARALKGAGEIRCFVANDEDTPNYQNGRISFIDTSTKEPIKGNNKPQFSLVFYPFGSGTNKTTYHCLKEVMSVGAALLLKRVA